MFTLRCTRKLLARLGSTPTVEKVEPTTRLGDWYANLTFRPGGRLVLFVNERSLLPVLVLAVPASTLLTRFPAAAADLLLRLGVPGALFEAERREMAEVRIGKTMSRQLLSAMTDFAYPLGVQGRKLPRLRQTRLRRPALAEVAGCVLVGPCLKARNGWPPYREADRAR